MDISIQEPYQYLPITNHDGIRLIVPHPSPDKAAVVQCQIIHTTLRQAQQDIYDHYTALSYVWGDPNDTTSISVDGYPLRVTKSLECALRHMRDDKRALNVWADGVCVNQQDEAEKGRQVQQMGRVYETATHTIIFLGEGECSAESIISRVLSRFERTSFVPIEEYHEDTVEVLHHLLSCEWFYRVWIFQELVLSKDPKVQYGRFRFSWHTLCKIANFVGFQLKTERTGPERCDSFSLPSSRNTSLQDRLSLRQRINIIEQMNAAKFKAAQSSFEKLHTPSGARFDSIIPLPSQFQINQTAKFEEFIMVLASRRGFGVSDPRDMIYAHLGLMDLPDLEVRYEMTTVQTFQTLVEQCISATRSFKIFAHIENVDLELRRPGLATWAVDWTLCQATPRYLDLTKLGYKFDDDEWSWANDEELACHFDNGVLLARAGELASVQILGNIMDTTSYIPYLAESKTDSKKKIGRGYLSKEGSAGSWLENQVEGNQEFASVLDESTYLWRALERTNLVKYLLKAIEGSSDSVQSIVDCRRLACLRVKTQPFFALVPASTKIGDLVYVLKGCAMPFVFRRMEDFSETGETSEGLSVNLIGTCLVDQVLIYTHSHGKYRHSVGWHPKSTVLLNVH
jgi:hypothetical protein